MPFQWEMKKFYQLPSATPLYFIEFYQWSKISPLSSVILVFGKARSCRMPNWGYKGAESPVWLDVSPKTHIKQDARVAHCHDKAANHQLPIAVAFWITKIVSAEECSSLMQNMMQIHCSTCSIILNVAATWYTCSLNGVYHPHWLVQWSNHCSHMHIPVHSPWLPGYIDVTQTILFIVTMVRLFPVRPCIGILRCNVYYHVILLYSFLIVANLVAVNKWLFLKFAVTWYQQVPGKYKKIPLWIIWAH